MGKSEKKPQVVITQSKFYKKQKRNYRINPSNLIDFKTLVIVIDQPKFNGRQFGI